MAATVEVRVTYGEAGSEQTVESDAPNLNLLSVDDYVTLSTVDNPIVIPDAGSNYSCERWFRVYVADMGGSSKLKNFRVYADTDEPITNAVLKYGQTDTYDTPKDTASSIATANIPTSEPAENLYIGGAPDGEITTAGNYTDYGVLQLEVPSTTTFGVCSTVNITIMWDEVA